MGVFFHLATQQQVPQSIRMISGGFLSDWRGGVVRFGSFMGGVRVEMSRRLMVEHVAAVATHKSLPVPGFVVSPASHSGRPILFAFGEEEEQQVQKGRSHVLLCRQAGPGPSLVGIT